MFIFFFFQAEDGIRDIGVTGVQTCALPISGCPTDQPHYAPLVTTCQSGTGMALPAVALAHAGTARPPHAPTAPNRLGGRACPRRIARPREGDNGPAAGSSGPEPAAARHLQMPDKGSSGRRGGTGPGSRRTPRP